MGGDFGPEPVVEGTVEALKIYDFEPVLVGKRAELLSLIPSGFKDKISILDAEDVIAMSDSATDALKRKESSVYKAVDLVRNKEAHAIVSAGHSGATMTLATMRLGRLKHVLRPALVTLMPNKNRKRTVLLDVGANVDCKPEHLVQFAVMGSCYAHDMWAIPVPSVGLLANGEEESKGNDQTKDTFRLLRDTGFKGFKGNVEGPDLFDGSVDVVVCDGFVGNLVLKSAEGVASTITFLLKDYIRHSYLAMVGALMMRKVFALLRRDVDYAEVGGAPLIGVKGCAIVSHGKSNAKAIRNAIKQAIDFVDSGVNAHIESALEAGHKKV